MRRATDTPTCRASTGCRHCENGVPNHDSGPASARVAAAAAQDRRQASGESRSDKTASTTASLALHQALVLGEMRPLDGRIELVGFGKSTRHYQIEMSERPCLCLGREPNLY